MNKVLLGGALVGAVVVGGYFYAANSLHSSIEQMVASYNESIENEFTVSYGDRRRFCPFLRHRRARRF